MLCRSITLRVIVVLFAVLATPAHAFFNKVKPGEMPTLDADEGLLVVAVDTPSPIAAVQVTYQDGLFTKAKLKDIPAGGSMALFRMKAGSYQWAEVDTPGWHARVDLSDVKDLDFRIEAGKINFPGALVLRDRKFFINFHVANRSLRVLDWLREQHAATLARFGFRYSGHYPDPFPEFLAKEGGNTAEAAVDTTRSVEPWAPAAGKYGELSKPGRIQRYSLNPSGTALVTVSWESGKFSVDLTDLTAMEVVRLFSGPRQIEAIDWKDDNTVLIGQANSASGYVYGVIQGDPAKPIAQRYSQMWVPRPGYVIQTLPDDPAHVLFQTRSEKDKIIVIKLDVSSRTALAKSMKQDYKERLNPSLDQDRFWIAGRNGDLMLALAQHADAFALARRSGDTFRDVFTFQQEHLFLPQSLSTDGRYVYGLTEDGREQTELVELDLDHDNAMRTVFAKPGTDVVSAAFDRDGRPTGVYYYDQGSFVAQYFDDDATTLMQRFSASLHGQRVLVASRSANGAKVVIAASSSERGETYYLFDREHDELSELDVSRPWLAARAARSVRTLSASSSDGLAVEAYLTLPPGDAVAPLIVYPHGGPIFIRDSVGFDPEVQFLTDQGFAVLQVNFRGSAGYGKAFRNAGKGSFGTRIEDDIDAALAVALKDPRIDGHRACVMGASYGGYSAMIEAIRWPQRYRCAVALAGVSDRALFFTASDSGRTAAGRKALEAYVGNPNEEIEAMVATSPLYHYRELTTPLFLVHGDQDLRVDYEHTARLVRMLNVAGHPPSLYVVKGGGHGGFSTAEDEQVWTRVAGFLHQHLDAP